MRATIRIKLGSWMSMSLINTVYVHKQGGIMKAEECILATTHAHGNFISVVAESMCQRAIRL
jgi:hypothetical protein